MVSFYFAFVSIFDSAYTTPFLEGAKSVKTFYWVLFLRKINNAVMASLVAPYAGTTKVQEPDPNMSWGFFKP